MLRSVVLHKMVSEPATDRMMAMLPERLRKKAIMNAPGGLSSSPREKGGGRGSKENNGKREAEPLSQHAEGVLDFVSIRCATDPSMVGLHTLTHDTSARIKKKLRGVFDESIGSNAASAILESFSSLSDMELSVHLTLLQTSHYGKYQGKGNSERQAIELCCNNMGRVCKVPMKGLAGMVHILCNASLEKEKEIDMVLDEVVTRIAGGKLRDLDALVSILQVLADSDHNAPVFFQVCLYHISLTMERVSVYSLLPLVTAYRRSDSFAEDLFQVVQARVLQELEILQYEAEVDEKEGGGGGGEDGKKKEQRVTLLQRIGYAMHTEQRHPKSSPMIARGGQQEWLAIPGFDQSKK